ncbi:unnamed protein product [Prunus armeniaca]
MAGCVPTYEGRYDCVRAGENVARPKLEVACVVGVAGVLTDPIRGRVRPVVWGVIVILVRSHMS